jgi:hypothetical protein
MFPATSFSKLKEIVLIETLIEERCMFGEEMSDFQQ